MQYRLIKSYISKSAVNCISAKLCGVVLTSASWRWIAATLEALVTSAGQTLWPLAESVLLALLPVAMTERRPPWHKHRQTSQHC